MSILLDSGNTENKPRLCATDGHNNLQINQTVIGFLSEFVSVGLHRVPYPGTGESENKVTSAHDEALKTVGYGRLEKPCTVYYNNPFDPRLTFDGLGHLLTATDTVTGSLSKEQLAQNVFLALENSDVVMDDLFSQNRNLYQALCSSTDLGLSVDPNRYKLFPEIDGNVSEDGSEDCKRMFEKICSHPIKDLWTHTQEGTERVTCDTDRKPDSPDQTAKKTHTANEHCQCEAEKNSPKTHNLPEKNPPKNKIRYSYKRLEGKKKSSVEPDQNALYDLIERDIEQVLSEESDEEDRGRISDSKVTPIHLMTGDTMTGARLTAEPKCPREVTQTGEEATKTEPTLSGTRNAQHKEPHFTTAELKHGVRQVPLDPCQNDPVQTTTTNETGSAYKEAKIQEFKEEMEKITSRKDVPKTLVVTGDPHITTQNNAPSHMEYSEFSLDSIVAKSVLRPSVPSFYPGFNKGGTAAIENEHMFVRKTQTTAHNRGTRPPPGIGQNTYGDQNGAHNAQGPPNWANTSAAPQTQNTGHVATGNFQNHNTAAMRDATQKIDFRSTLINPRPCHQPANVNKLQLQPTHAATAALLMANCIQQSSGKDAASTVSAAMRSSRYAESVPRTYSEESTTRLQRYYLCSHAES
ncbi:hypothetical protein KP79_PYT08631 [Mizuhopecten yessoensis]|uniref:Uncharacterized protein n=1 Tax=Mizuhopecten yessoensis TaxID=6573 RepID=A0A210R0H4_MIZYE|nr:hypothetical protein KP79_PYT08631 [Mizuhopecten yessoensis]